jgi:hypothetical protein
MPNVSITYPLNTTYYNAISNLNYTYLDAENCWYSTNRGINNITITCGNNVTGLTSGEGSNDWRVWVNDTVNNVNQSRVLFTIDTTPYIKIDYPLNSTYYSSTLNLNYTAINATGNCWYSTNGGVLNTTVICGNNIIGLPITEGTNTWIVGANSSFNALNQSKITFTVDTTPYINISYPTNVTYNTAFLNLIYETANATVCGVSQDSGINNITSTCGSFNNYTAFTAAQGSNKWMAWSQSSLLARNNTFITFFVDSIIPNVTIVNPLNTTHLEGYVFQNNLSVIINWTEADTNLDTCWYNNGTTTKNTTVTCGANASLNMPYGSYNFKVWVNDTANNINMSTLFTTYAYSVLETNFSYNNQTMSGLVETFSINATVNPMYSGALVYLTYNNTNYTMTTSDTGTNKIWSKSLSIPVVTGWTNKTFFFSFILVSKNNMNI